MVRAGLPRRPLLGALALGLGATLPPCGRARAKGGTLRFLIEHEPTTLVTIAHTAGPSTRVSPKVTEGLLTYDLDFRPQPALATRWSVAEDGLTYSFALRPNVRWHDGKPFTSADVAHSIRLLREHHPRGRGTFAAVAAVDTPDALNAVIRLSRPAPYLLMALDASESPIVPRHIYEGTDPLTNRNAGAPVGTGPFVFREWQKGSHIILARNPNYWDETRPRVERIVITFTADPAARSAAFEAGEVDLGGGPPVPRSDLARLLALPFLGSERRGAEYNGSMTQLYFNYETAALRDRRVRLAIAHAIDVPRLLSDVYFGYGKLAPSAISPNLAAFVDPSIRHHAFDPDLAGRLLDEAGLPRQGDGTRLALRLYANPFNGRAAGDLVKQFLQRIGVAVDFQFFDFSTYIQKAYTGRQFDLTLESLSNTFDPTPGLQRVFWSRNFKVGLPFSNVSSYENPEIDRLLEAAAVEPDPARRKALWFEFQHRIHDDVAAVHLIAPDDITVFNRRVRNQTTGVTGMNGSFADVSLDG